MKYDYFRSLLVPSMWLMINLYYPMILFSNSEFYSTGTSAMFVIKFDSDDGSSFGAAMETGQPRPVNIWWIIGDLWRRVMSVYNFSKKGLFCSLVLLKIGCFIFFQQCIPLLLVEKWIGACIIYKFMSLQSWFLSSMNAILLKWNGNTVTDFFFLYFYMKIYVSHMNVNAVVQRFL